MPGFLTPVGAILRYGAAEVPSDPVDSGDIKTVLDETDIATQGMGQLQSNGITDNHQQWNLTLPTAGRPGFYEHVADPDGGLAENVLRLRSNSTDTDTAGAIRTEVAFRANSGSYNNWIDEGEDYWLVAYLQISDRTALTGGHICPIQIHEGRSSPPSGNPPIACYLNGSSMDITGRLNTSEAFSVVRTQAFDTWEPWIVHLNMNDTGGGGRFHLWINDTLVVEHDGNIGYNTAPDGSKGYYAKFGQYFYSAGSGLPAGTEDVFLAYAALIADDGYAYLDIKNHLSAQLGIVL